MAGAIRIGISGWRYPPWRGRFYPKNLAQREELAYASRRFGSIEINGSFYRLQRPELYARWREETPAGFVFSVKGSRFITHMKRLRDIETPLANFFASGVLALGEKLGPILWQFPRAFRYDAERMEAFFRLLPGDTAAAERLAKRHDQRLAGRAWLKGRPVRRLRHAVEIRHESFFADAFVAQLRRHGIALVVSDAGENWPLREDVTADFVYVRLHGAEALYASGYAKRELDRWAERARAWSQGGEPADARRISSRPPPRRKSRDIYLYFDNDAKVRAPGDARRLARRLAEGGAGR